MPLADDPQLVRAPKLSEQIAQLLQTEISSGTLKPGEKLPSEALLCQRFGVSRTVVREATARLEYDGLIETRQGARNVVCGPHNRRVFRIDRPSHYTFKEFAQLYELRIIMESSAAALAAERRGKKHLQELKACIAEMESADPEGDDGVAANVLFHQLVAAASGNKFLSDFMMFLNDKITAMLFIDKKIVRDGDVLNGIHREHRAIYDALKQKDAAGARASIERHIVNAAQRHGVELKPLKP
jgi:GntR family transcriptional regulator, transcriptional repressor for pyruvate dehydrogenase complex